MSGPITLDELCQEIAARSGAGVHHVDEGAVALLARAGDAAGLVVVRVDLEGLDGKRALLARLAEALRFPDWFGHNWDALADCLGDLSWWPAPGYVLIVENATAWRQLHPRELEVLVSIFGDTAAAWHARHVAFHVVVAD